MATGVESLFHLRRLAVAFTKVPATIYIGYWQSKAGTE
jgi:hypothetical protein